MTRRRFLVTRSRSVVVEFDPAEAKGAGEPPGRYAKRLAADIPAELWDYAGQEVEELS